MRYQKKPVIIEAFKLTPDYNQIETPEWLDYAIEDGTAYVKGKGTKRIQIIIKSQRGVMIANVGDYIIKDTDGKLYPCEHNLFKEIYEVIK